MLAVMARSWIIGQQCGQAGKEKTGKV